MIQKTAILIFANSAKREGEIKIFPKAAVLFDALNKQVIKKVEKTGLPHFVISESQQTGATFGERYTNAIEQVYAKGFDNVITIGNDTPHLNSNQLLTAAKNLEENKIVLGPSKDGGYYLLGLNKSQFNKAKFLQLPWQTSGLTASLSRLLSVKKIEVLFLKTLQDIDTISNVKKLLDGFKNFSAKILKIVITIFSSEILKISNILIFISAFQQENYFNKGSPYIIL
ncbi:hypothetical protein ULMS_08520 [Patiriisocius marinistellae]|uniref:DUF2064 domain-containing protein n=1 Tax=Patiriisocius marinistellae TaxID=2494560 RepID=A0A5J4FW41_9FLAO|nr:DUF2064 domain-containing protein [Patiriisocius marinistellae]GEQ85344.1 hypothetical protein ULMS_08520 [Patiriisocius marinistellae]